MFFSQNENPICRRPAFDPMNNILSLVSNAHPSSHPNPGLYSDHMLAELLALQEEMIAQLRRERLMVISTADFLTNMIDNFLSGAINQHEKSAAILRTQFENHHVDAA